LVESLVVKAESETVVLFDPVLEREVGVDQGGLNLLVSVKGATDAAGASKARGRVGSPLSGFRVWIDRGVGARFFGTVLRLLTARGKRGQAKNEEEEGQLSEAGSV
jgi:hypothetical protein